MIAGASSATLQVNAPNGRFQRSRSKPCRPSPPAHADALAARTGAAVSRWLLTYEGYDPEVEGLREALCTLGNGYVATRGAAPSP